MTGQTSLTPDFYEVLNLPFPDSSIHTTTFSKQHLKVAYHKALLRHHPDKAPSAAGPTSKTLSSHETNQNGSPTTSNRVFTIDEITAAYKTLSDPYLRAEYDRSLRLDRARIAEKEKTGTVFHTGLEVVDLEDLDCEEGADGALWYRGCRCGDERGFLVTEGDLEREVEHGEIVVGCRGCSLWMKVLFAVQDDDDDDNNDNGTGQKT